MGGDDEVVEHINLHQPQRVAQGAGQAVVGVARRGVARWVVVRKDDCGGVVLQRDFHHFARPHSGFIDGAAEQFFHADQSVAGVE